MTTKELAKILSVMPEKELYLSITDTAKNETTIEFDPLAVCEAELSMDDGRIINCVLIDVDMNYFPSKSESDVESDYFQ